VCNNLDTLVWLANLAAIEIHMTLSRVGSYESPDLVLFDVDPKAPFGFDEAVKVALFLKESLDELALRSFVKTSGKKGLHVVVPVIAGYTYEQTRSFVHRVAQDLAKKSEMVVSEFVDARKPGVVFIDYRQNSEGRTMVCPYSLRATPEATVSAPLSWSSFGKKIKPSDFTLLTLIKKEDNPWKELFSVRHKLEV
jgi:bifunctional non-homologous end joining protein LigD